jgi:leucyl-tRNA synthetase
MSKSKYNVVNPDDMVALYGADCFRMYEMFLGPIDQAKPWDTKGIDGVAKFLRKVWSLFYNDQQKIELSTSQPTKEENKILHQCIKRVTDDMDRFSFNTCVSAFMVCVNELKRIKCENKIVLGELLKLLAPFAPHISEELWASMGGEYSISNQNYPNYTAEYLIEDLIEYPVCINGKKRALLELPNGVDQQTAQQKALEMPEIIKWLEETPAKKIIVVPGKMINIVV